jgi:hypothetical protein
MFFFFFFFFYSCRQADEFKHHLLLTEVTHLRLMKQSLASRISKPWPVENVLDALAYAKEAAMWIATNKRYPRDFPNNLAPWLLCIFKVNNYLAPVEHQFPILIEGKLIPWCEVVSPTTKETCLKVLADDNSPPCVWVRNYIAAHTPSDDYIKYLEGIDVWQQFTALPPLPLDPKDGSTLAVLNWMAGYGTEATFLPSPPRLLV